MSAIFDSILSGGFSVGMFLACLAAAGLCGLIASLIMSRSGEASKGFLISLVVLPMVVCTVILMVNGSVGTGIAVAGAFSLVRFRSAPGSGKEIAAVFTAMAVGLACGMGSPALAALFTLILCAVEALYSAIGFGGRRGGEKRRLLHITVPESLEYAEVFDDLFARFCAEAKLLRVKTANLGSLNRLTYEIELREAGSEKALIDELRCRNGNLEISLSVQTDDPAEL